MSFIGSFDQGSFENRLSKQLGQGLQKSVDTAQNTFQDQYKKQFERSRLASDLEKLNRDMAESKAMGKPLTPLQYNQRLASIGLDAQSLSTLSQMYNQNLRQPYYTGEGGSSGTDQPTAKPSTKPTAKPSEQIRKTQVGEYNYFNKDGSIRPYVNPTPEDRRIGVGKIINELGLDVLQAEKLFDEQQTQIKKNTEDLIENTEDLENKFKEKLNAKLEREAIKDLSGNIIDRKYQQVRSEWINNREDIDQTADKAATELFDLAKKLKDFKRGMVKPSFARNKETTNRLRSEISKEYEKFGARDELARSYIMDMGIESPLAYWLAYDGVQNKELSNYIKNNKGSQWRGGISSKDIAPKIASMITSNDSLMAIASELIDANYDAEQFLNYVANTPQIRAKLTKSQENELLNPTEGDFLSPLYNWWYSL